MDNVKNNDDNKNDESDIENSKNDKEKNQPSCSINITSSELESCEEKDSSFQEFNIDDKLEERLKKQGLNRRNVKTIIHELLKDSNVRHLLKANLDDLPPKLDFPEKINLRSNSVKPSLKGAPTFTEIALPDEDDEDEEYKPTHDDILSSVSQDTIASTLDTTIESIEVTPKKLKIDESETKSSFYNDLQECEDEIKAINEKARNYSEMVDDEIIALRTRSKQSLHDTNLIELETAFKPPDVTEDMYLPLGDDDWHKWLAELMLDVPETVLLGVEEDDPVEDPDYNFLGSESDDHVDKDDFRDDHATHISKKEVQELLEQIDDMEDIDFRGNSLLEPITPIPTSNSESNFNKKLTVKDIINSKKENLPAKKTETAKEELLIQFNRDQLQTLDLQMRQHIQLLTQVNLLSRNNSKLTSVVQNTHSLLQELHNFGEHNQTTFNTVSKFKASSLQDALKIVESTVKKSEPVTRASKYERSRKMLPISLNVATIMANSSVFSFVELLPTCAANTLVKEQGRITFSEAEDNLIVLGIEQMENHFSPCHILIHQYMNPVKTPEQIKSRYTNAKQGHYSGRNSIQIYKQSGLKPRPPKAMKPAIGYGTKVKDLLHLRHHWKPDWLIALQQESGIVTTTNYPNKEIIQNQLSSDRNGHMFKNKKEENFKKGQLDTNPQKILPQTSNIISYNNNIPISSIINIAPIAQTVMSPQLNPVIILPSVIPVSNVNQFLMGSTGQIQMSPAKLPNWQLSPLKSLKSKKTRRNQSPYTSIKKAQLFKSKSGTKNASTVKISKQLKEVNNQQSATIKPTSQSLITQAPLKRSIKIKSMNDDQFGLDIATSSDDSVISDLEYQEKHDSAQNQLSTMEKTKQTSPEILIRNSPPSNRRKSLESLNLFKQQVTNSEVANNPNTSISKRKQKKANAVSKNGASTPKRLKTNNINEANLTVPEVVTKPSTTNQPSIKKLVINNESPSNLVRNTSPQHSDFEAINGESDADDFSDADVGKEIAKSPKNLKSRKKWKHKLKVKWRKNQELSAKKSGKILYSLTGKSGARSKDEDDLSKSLRESAEKVRMLEEDTIVQLDPTRVEKELLFAQGYLKRMEESLKDHPDVLLKVLEVLCEFDQNSSQSPPMLYNKLSRILEKWPDLLQGFAPFLMPEQAHACGLFSEQQVYARARKFLRQLEIRFQGNPSHLNKILNAFRTVAESGIYIEKEIKGTILALLKAEPYLQEQFLMFFDNEQPPESRLVGDYEEIIWTDDLLKDTKQSGHENIYVPISEENIISEVGHSEITSKSPPVKNINKKIIDSDKTNEEPVITDKELDDCEDLEREGWDEEKTEDETEEDSDAMEDVGIDLRGISSQEILSSDIGIVSEDALSCSPFKKFTPLGGAKLMERNKNFSKESANRPFTPTESQESQDSLSLPPVSKKLDQSSFSSVGSNLPLTPSSSERTHKKDSLTPEKMETNKSVKLKSVTNTELLTKSKTKLIFSKTQVQNNNTSDKNTLHKKTLPTDLIFTSNKLKLKPSSSSTQKTQNINIENIPETDSTDTNDDLECKESVISLTPTLESPTNNDIEKQSVIKDNEARNCEIANKQTEQIILSESEDGVFKWTREEDGLLLMICKENGATQQTFQKVGEMVQRSPKQISDRFNQLLALISGANAESDTTSQTSDTDDDDCESQTD